MGIATIIRGTQVHRVRVADHVDEEASADHLALEEIYSSVLRGEVIEGYTADKPYPSCLIFGRTSESAPVHSVSGYNDENRWAVLITVYRPDPERWIGWRVRKRRP